MLCRRTGAWRRRAGCGGSGRGCGRRRGSRGRSSRRLRLGVGVLAVGGGGFGGRLAALGGVVVHIPARALEVQPRRGQRALEQAVALRTFGLLLCGKVLDLLKTMATLGAAIGIERKGWSPSGENSPNIPILSAGQPIICKIAALPEGPAQSRSGINARPAVPMPSDLPTPG